MTIATIQLEDFIVRNLTVREKFAVAPQDRLRKVIPDQIDFNFFEPDKPGDWYEVVLFMRVNSDEQKRGGKQPGYDIELQIHGKFSLAKPGDKENMALLAANGPAILYGIARGIVSQSTGCGRLGSVVLGCVNFHELMKQKIEKNKETRGSRVKTVKRRLKGSGPAKSKKTGK